LNITLLTNSDLASNFALNALYRGLEPRHQLRVLLSARVGKQGTFPKALTDLAFAEQTLFNQIVFPALKQSEDSKTRLLSFDNFRQRGLFVEQISSINCEQGQQVIREGQPDLIISIRFGLILKPAVLTIPKYGVLNLHSGKLPDYRGVMACFRAMQNNEVEHSSTLHYITDGSIDTGNIIDINTLALNYEASYLENMLNLYQGGVKQLLRAINTIESEGYVASQAQAEAGQYFSFPSEAEIDDFFARGLRLFDYPYLSRMVKKFI
jgi:methionyl-tRNA formyltransferase